MNFKVVHVFKNLSNSAMKRLSWSFFNVTKSFDKHAALTTTALQQVLKTPLEELKNGEDLWDSRIVGLVSCLHLLGLCDTGYISISQMKHLT